MILNIIDNNVSMLTICIMKNLICLVSLLGFLGCSSESFAYIYSAGGEKISIVEDLPYSEEWNYNGQQVDACVIYKQFWILWVPLWNWDARFVLAEDGSEEFYEIDDTDLSNRLKNEYGEATSVIPFWDKIGGKLMVPLIFVVFYIIGILSPDESDESDEAEEKG
jgi:hypothetical protein